MKMLSSPELVDHCAVRNVETAADLLKNLFSLNFIKKEHVLELSREYGGFSLNSLYPKTLSWNTSGMWRLPSGYLYKWRVSQTPGTPWEGV